MQLPDVKLNLFHELRLGQEGTIAPRLELRGAVCLEGEGGVLGLDIYFLADGIELFFHQLFVIGDFKLDIPLHRGAFQLVSHIGGEILGRVVAHLPGGLGSLGGVDFQLDVLRAVLPALVLVGQDQGVLVQLLGGQVAEKGLHLLPAHAREAFLTVVNSHGHPVLVHHCHDRGRDRHHQGGAGDEGEDDVFGLDAQSNFHLFFMLLKKS